MDPCLYWIYQRCAGCFAYGRRLVGIFRHAAGVCVTRRQGGITSGRSLDALLLLWRMRGLAGSYEFRQGYESGKGSLREPVLWAPERSEGKDAGGTTGGSQVGRPHPQ